MIGTGGHTIDTEDSVSTSGKAVYLRPRVDILTLFKKVVPFHNCKSFLQFL